MQGEDEKVFAGLGEAETTIFELRSEVNLWKKHADCLDKCWAKDSTELDTLRARITELEAEHAAFAGRMAAGLNERRIECPVGRLWDAGRVLMLAAGQEAFERLVVRGETTPNTDRRG